MPVVDCVMSSSRCLVSFSRIGLALAALLITNAQCSVAQETAEPAVQTSQEASASLDDQYRKAILKQQQWTREIAAIKNPLLPEDAEAEFTRNVLRNYRTLLTNGPNLNNANDLQTMRQGLQFRILRASDPAIFESPRMMQIILNELKRDLKSAGNQINDPQNKQRFRTEVMKEAHSFLRQLLENSLDARGFAINVLIDLEVVAASFDQKRIVIYDEVDDTLAGILSDPNQPDSVRAMAANSIRLFLQKTEALPVDQMKLAAAVTKELARIETEYTYQLLLIDALCHVSQPREIIGRAVPTVYESMISLISNPQRFLNVRCRAARCLGRTGYDGQINFEPLAWKVAQLSVEAGQFFNQNPSNIGFQQCGVDLYVAFHHLSSSEQNDPRNTKGMLNRAPRSQVVKDAYKEVLKIAGPMIFTSRAIPASDLAAVNEWVKSNVPANPAYDASGNGSPVPK